MENGLSDSGYYPAEHFISKSMDSDAPIFLTGFARSGTTWVNHLFRDYFDAGFVNEGQFIVSFGLRLHRYENLKEPGNHRRLMRDLAKDRFFSILRRNYAIEIDWGRVGAVKPEFSAIVREVLRQIAEGLGKHRIGSKYPVFGRYMDLMNTLFPDCRVVHVIRDGRDCALSHKRMTWGHQNTYSAAVHWRDYLRTLRSSAEKLPGRYLEIRYEDLLLNPESTMRILEYFVTGTHQDSATRHFLEKRGALKPNKVGQWRRAMSPHSQAVFEAVAGDTLREYGYALVGEKHYLSSLSRAGCIIHDRVSREAWYWARKIVPKIPEHKPWS